MTRGQHRGAFAIEQLSGQRFQLALERLQAGHSFEFRDIAFSLAPDGALLCVVDSSWQSCNVTLTTAARDLEEGRRVFVDLLESSPEFAAVVHGRPVRYELIEDCGGAGILIATKVDDAIVWACGFTPSGE